MFIFPSQQTTVRASDESTLIDAFDEGSEITVSAILTNKLNIYVEILSGHCEWSSGGDAMNAVKLDGGDIARTKKILSINSGCMQMGLLLIAFLMPLRQKSGIKIW